MTEPRTRRQIWAFALLIAVVVLATYWPALRCGFVNYDDPQYVTANPFVQSGLNWQSLKWALVTAHVPYWHPLTWLSHMIDFQLYGLNPWGHHLTSLLFHVANSVVLFLLLNSMTGATGRSAFVAALFALHPLRVESVVWISERKDVLSAFFCLLTIWSYFKFQISKLKVFGVLSLLFFALGLAAKPMLVTLPFVLLLLDYWPLNRRLSWRMLVEKIPFLLLAAACSFMTFTVQNLSEKNFPAAARWANVPIAYVRYLSKIFWPFHLSFFYSYRAWPMLEVVEAGILLGLISGVVVWRWRKQPYLAVGWGWFIGMLVPVIGLVQAGSQAMADRFTYLPSIGIGIMVVWAIHEWAPRRPAIIAGVLFLAACSILASQRVPIFRDSETLWRATLREDPNSPVALDNLARCLIDQQRFAEAIASEHEALAIRPTDAEAKNNLAIIDLRTGKIDDAVTEAQASLGLQPHNAQAYDIMAQADLKKGRVGEAKDAYRKALELDPSLAEAWCNLGFCLLQQHRTGDAVVAYQKALDLDPNYALAHNDLGNILLQEGHTDDALAHFVRAAQIKADFGEAHYNIAEILLRKGRIDEALAEYQKAVASLPNLAPARARIAEILHRKGEGSEH
jgi:tetratricopeptide (TPR) repeat protein